MKLKRIFQSAESAFNEAVETDDLDRMRKLMHKKGSWISFEILSGDYVKHMSPDMARLFIDEMDDDVLNRWNFKAGSKGVVMMSVVVHALQHKRNDLALYVLQSDVIDFKDSDTTQLAGVIISSSLDNETKLPWLKKALSSGYEQIKDTDDIVQRAIRHAFPEALNLFAAIGIDLHKSNEQFLRYAAEQGAKDMAKHLVVGHQADLDLAISTSRELGSSAQSLFLETLKTDIEQEAPAQPEKPPTLEGLAAEVRELKATVRELTAVIQDMRTPDKKLDKPAIPQPKK